MIDIIPAILTDDPETFKQRLVDAEAFGARTAQVDFTDGKFVDSKTLLPDDLDAFVLGNSTLTLEAHLMVEHPEQYFATLYTLGFRRIAVHLEAITEPQEIIEEIREYGMELGFAINPETPLSSVEVFINDLDFILFMTVVPGEMGRPFEESVLEKINLEHIHNLKEKHHTVVIEVDGGVNKQTLPKVLTAGATRIVVGSAIWKEPNPNQAFTDLHEQIQ